jgi:myosin heavy subunit
MRSSTDKKRLDQKVISYEEYLQLKKSYITLREKNKKLKEEKQKIESILKEYQKHITDYKSSNKAIKMLLQKIESNYKELKLTKEEKNILLKAKKSDFENEVNNIQEETFKKTLKDMRDNNEIITNEYNNTINRYIEVINQLKREIQLKEELYKNNNNANTIIVEKPSTSTNIINSSFKNLVISSNTCELNIIQEINETENDNNNEDENENVNNNNFNDKLFISSNICEVNIIQETPKNKELQLDISSNICEINVLKEETPKIFLNELISICSNTCEINIPSKEKEEEESKKSLNDKFLENLEIISNIAEICFIPEKNEKNQKL